MPFDKMKSKIAITLPEFTLLKHSDPRTQRYNEPYIVSLAVDANGKANPKIEWNHMPFPKVRVGGKVTMLGDGHLLYGPKNPGEFVAISVLFMECDKEIREFGKFLEGFLADKVVARIAKGIIAARPEAAAILGVLKELTQFLAGRLKENKDDELFRTEGTFLRDHPCPYHIDRAYTIANDYIEASISIVPLEKANKEGAPLKAITVKK
jgi:hypothetical protein